MADDRFGEIKIDTGPPAESKGSDVLLSQLPDDGEQGHSNELENSTFVSEPNSYRQRQEPPHKYRLPMPYVKTAVWLLIIPLLVILYGVGSYFLVPISIKGLITPKLSHHFDRPIEIGRIVFSPFKLELFVDDITIGSVQGDRTGKKLFTSEKARFQFSLGRIFDGKLWCKQLVIDGILLNVVRHKDSKIDLEKISDLFLSHSAGQGVKYWPAWLFLDEVKVNNGQIIIDDRKAQKAFAIEQIQFYLPSADTRNRDKAVLPKLNAVIDSSPFVISAVRLRNQSGAWRTGFSFEFKKIIMDNFKEFFPKLETGLLLSEGEADIDLDIILPENQNGSEGIVIEGEANLRAVKWHDPDAQTGLSLAEARIVYNFMPRDKLIRLKSVEFHEPELDLDGKGDGRTVQAVASLEYLHSVLKKVSLSVEVLKVESFLWNNGKIIMDSRNTAGSKTVWNDVTFSLKGLTTAGYRAVYSSETYPAHYTFRARDISTKPAADFFSEGEISTDIIMKGKMEINRLDLARYPTLLPSSVFGLQKGNADISMHYEYAGRFAPGQENASHLNRIFNSTFKTTGYVFTRNGKKAVAGEMMACSRFHFDMVSRTVVCEQLEVLKSKIFNDILFDKKSSNQAAGPGNWQFVVNNLQVSGSSIHTSLKGVSANKKKSKLVIQDVTLESRNLQSEKRADNVKASGRIGKKGILSVSGNYSLGTGQGKMELDLQELELSLLQTYFSSWFVPKLNKGKIGANGILLLPGKEFTGKVQIDDLDAGGGSGAVVRINKAFCDNCTYRHAPMAIYMDELVVQRPSFKSGLSSGDIPIKKYLHLQDETVPSTVRIGRIRVEDGSFALSEPIIYPGYQPLLQNIYGTLTPIDQASQLFSIKGKINEQGSFALQGSGSMTSILSYHLDVQNFSLLPFDSVLKRDAGFSSQQTSASWTQEMISKNNISKVATTITLQDVIPDPAHPTSAILSLIINEKHRFEMTMDGQYSNTRPRPFLLEQLVKRLRHMEVKFAISPYLVVKETAPELDLAQRVSFAPGSTHLEETAPLVGYQQLLAVRPFIMLRLQGQYDPVFDKEVLQAELQEEVDQHRDIENKRRAMEKTKILQQKKRMVKEIKDRGQGVVTEEILPDELITDLQPLPRIKVQLERSKLEELARQRAQVLQSHLVNKLQLDPARITIKSGVAKKTSSVEIELLPNISVERETIIDDE